MYKGFNLELHEDSDFGIHLLEKYSSRTAKFSKAKNDVRSKISAFMRHDGGIDAKLLQQEWFKLVRADIFISHSHADEKLAMAIAAALDIELGLNCFIDSCVWGNANELLKEIDEEFCLRANGETYDYNKRNRSTSHVHMMLQGALARMIDNTECIIFLNTPRAMVADRSLVEESRTASPWIYTEVLTTKIIRKEIPPRLLGLREASLESYAKNDMILDEMPSFYHDLDLTHLTQLNNYQFKQWLNNRSHRVGISALDDLYKL